jgi:hypothetical protein
MACDTCQERRLPQSEIIAAHAIEFALLKSKIAEFDIIADAILGAHVLVAIDEADYLTPKADRK